MWLNNRQVLAKDESYPEAILLLGMTHSLRRELDEAIRYYERAIEANPNHANAVGILGLNLAYAGRPEEAISALKKAMRLSPFYEEAKAVAANLLEVKPHFTIESYLKTQPFKEPERKEWVRSLLLKAGLPE